MSNSVATQQKRFIRLAPSNNASSFGPTSAQPIVRFSIADTQALALLQDARLNFKITVTKAGGNVAQTDDINIDSVLGMCAIMDQVIVSSRRFGTQIEQVVNLGRMESSYYRSKYSPKMMGACQYNQSRAYGLGRYNRWSGSTVNSSQTLDVRAVAQRKPIAKGVSTPCSIPIHAGIFLTEEPLDLSAVGGLEIAIYLQKPEAFFWGSNVDINSTDYTISDVSLSVPLIYKSAMDIAQTPSETMVEFLNWTSLYSVLDSTVSSIAHRIHLPGLVSAIHNMLPTSQINSRSANQFALKSIGIERLTFQRDGQRSPLEKTTIVQEETDATRDTVENRSTTTPEILTEYLSAYGPVKDLKYSQTIPELVKGIANRSGVHGMGCNYSPNSSGINVSGVLGIDVESKLEDVSTPVANGTEPYAMYSFYLGRQSYITSPTGMVAA